MVIEAKLEDENEEIIITEICKNEPRNFHAILYWLNHHFGVDVQSPQAAISEGFEWNIILKGKNYIKMITYWSNIQDVVDDQKLLDNYFIRHQAKVMEAERNDGKPEVEKVIFNYLDKSDLARQIIAVQPFYYDHSRTWWMWDKVGLFWDITDEVDILISIKGLSNVNTVRSSEKQEMMEALRQEARSHKPLDIKNTWVQFKGEIIDVRTGETIKASPSYFATNPIPHELGQSEDTPVIDNLFKEWVGEEYVPTLHEIIAYSMLPDYPIHRIFCFLGEGRNGKSRYLALVQKILGKRNTCAVELDNLLKSRFEAFRLYKKLCCLMGETNFGSMSKTGLLKSLTGQDLIGFEQKQKDPIQDINYAKILISTNNLPESLDKTEGFYRRWLLIDFPNKFPEGRDILETIPPKEINNICRKAINILQTLFDKGQFTNEGTIADRAKKYEAKSDPFSKFFEEHVEEDSDAYIFRYELKDAFKDYCKQNKLREYSEQYVNGKIKEHGAREVRKSPEMAGDKSYRAWSGFKLKYNPHIQESKVAPNN